ncbi:coenzyme F420-0:L-glutamate ligase [Candidatus Falkowbacteria bacterium]|nr:coenzyme F420-0:L-glutamate ligase [Candidatus Falkowbacteria bacterium]
MKIKPIRTPIFKPNQRLLPFLERALPRCLEGSVVVVTSKIVALSEGRVVPSFTAESHARIIRSESDWAMRTKYTWLTIKDSVVMASAGVDESNGNGQLILLPRDSFKSAARIRSHLRKKYKLKHLGVIITDSRCTPLRAGITGMAIGYAGFKGIKSYRGIPDIFGRRFHFSQVNVADSLAAAAVLCMGEGAERQPLAVITNAPIVFSTQQRRGELIITLKDDMFLPWLGKSRNCRLQI